MFGLFVLAEFGKGDLGHLKGVDALFDAAVYATNFGSLCFAGFWLFGGGDRLWLSAERRLKLGHL